MTEGSSIKCRSCPKQLIFQIDTEHGARQPRRLDGHRLGLVGKLPRRLRVALTVSQLKSMETTGSYKNDLLHRNPPRLCNGWRRGLLSSPGVTTPLFDILLSSTPANSWDTVYSPPTEKMATCPNRRSAAACSRCRTILELKEHCQNTL